MMRGGSLTSTMSKIRNAYLNVMEDLHLRNADSQDDIDDKSGTITEVLAEDGKLASVNTGHRYKNLDQERNSKRKQRNEDVHSSPSIENINSLKNELQNGVSLKYISMFFIFDCHPSFAKCFVSNFSLIFN
ncbi:BnaC01g31570D [Brassica napus]|uniref:BnaC01g31570D protein n=1 Tax=Brassica napus TaxID=3708 RepID=A0A078IAR9_BRANA|nr:BnaC01g31570D [Brassica napus]